MRQTPQARTRRRSSPGPGSGRGSSSSASGAPARAIRSARIDIGARMHALAARAPAALPCSASHRRPLLNAPIRAPLLAGAAARARCSPPRAAAIARGQRSGPVAAAADPERPARLRAQHDRGVPQRVAVGGLRRERDGGTRERSGSSPRRRRRARGRASSGTSSGHIVTNYHVVHGGEKFTVSLADGTTYEAKLVGVEPRKDLAVLQIERRRRRSSPVQLADSHQLLGRPEGARDRQPVRTRSDAHDGRDQRARPRDRVDRGHARSTT